MRTASEKAETSWNAGKGIRQTLRKMSQDAAGGEKQAGCTAWFGFDGQAWGIPPMLDDDVDCLLGLFGHSESRWLWHERLLSHFIAC